MHFFIDHTNLPDQLGTDGFGPDSVTPDTKYHLTSKFQLTVSAKAFACQSGMLVAQPAEGDGSLINVIIKPEGTLFASGHKIAYYVYRGIAKDSLITIDAGTTIVVPADSSNNELLARIYNVGADKTYLSDILGYASDNSVIVDTTQHIDTIFYNAGDTGPIKVLEGDWFGDFAAGAIGLEVITEADKLNIDIAFVRSAQAVVDVSSLTDDFQIRLTKENILGFMDPAALFGLHFTNGMAISTYSGSVKTTRTITGSELFNTLIDKFITKNNVYIDIRSERGYSYNFYNNYGDSDDNNIQVGPSAEGLTGQTYENNSWPILVRSGAPSGVANTATAWLALRIDDNNRPILFNLNIGGDSSKFVRVYDDGDGESGDTGGAGGVTSVDAWSSPFNYTYPVISSTVSVAYYIKSYYYRKQTAMDPPDTVPGTKKYYHCSFCPINLPKIGDQNIAIKKVEHHNSFLIDEPLQINAGTGGFSFAASHKVIWDADKVLFYSNSLSQSISSGQKFESTYPQKLTSIKTEVDDLFKNLDIICRLYHKTKLDGTIQDIKIIGVNNYFVTKNADKESGMFLGLSLLEYFSINNYPGLDNSAQKHIYLQRNIPFKIVDGIDQFYEYFISVQGLDSTGKAKIITPMFTNPVTSIDEAILVYSRDNLFFSSVNFSSSEQLSVQRGTGAPGTNITAYYADGKTGDIRRDNNIPDVEIAGKYPINYFYNGVFIAQFKTMPSNAMFAGVALGRPTKGGKTTPHKIDLSTEPPVDYPFVVPIDTGSQLQKSYRNAAGDILSIGNQGTDSNYQVLYKNAHSKCLLVFFNQASVNNNNKYNPITIHFTYSGTKRQYANPRLAAAVLAMLIELNLTLKCAGFSFKDGTCFPSVAHVRGFAIDLKYLPDENHPEFNSNQAIITILRKYNLEFFEVGLPKDNPVFGQFTVKKPAAIGYGKDHDTHLHGGYLVPKK